MTSPHPVQASSRPDNQPTGDDMTDRDRPGMCDPMADEIWAPD